MKLYNNIPSIRRHTAIAINIRELQLEDMVHCKTLNGAWYIASVTKISIAVSLYFHDELAVWVVLIDEIFWQPSLKRWECIKT